MAPSSTAPSRLQVAAGFSWDVGLSSLKPALAAQDRDSSDGEDEDIGSKVATNFVDWEKEINYNKINFIDPIWGICGIAAAVHTQDGSVSLLCGP